MDIDSLERNILAEFQPHHDHARHPEENNIVACYKSAGRVELLQLRCLIRPAHGFKRPQSGAEPGIQHILILTEMPAAALRADIHIGTGNDGLAAVIAVPGRDAVSPPQLAGNAPVADIVQPVAVNLGETLRHKFNIPVLYRLGSRLCQGFHLYKPLGGNHRLNGGVTA